MISNELLSEVYKNIISKIEYNGSNQYLTFWLNKNEYLTKNIFEISYRCKEWAMSYGYYIYSSPDGDIILINEDGNDISKIAGQPQADTEPESIFNACQWILYNKDK